jgi:hypothetical protein
VSDSFEQQRAHHELRKKREGGPVVSARPHCANHRVEIDASAAAGCFYCCETFTPDEIDAWIDEERTAICPRCGIDSVIGDASGFPIADKNFLKRMREFWFDA